MSLTGNFTSFVIIFSSAGKDNLFLFLLCLQLSSKENHQKGGGGVAVDLDVQHVLSTISNVTGSLVALGDKGSGPGLGFESGINLRESRAHCTALGCMYRQLPGVRKMFI